jgi:sugar (pentulose or hexulose) kinase
MDIGKGFHAIEEMGFPLDEIIACGGACVEGSPWNQIQADIYGKPIKLTKTSENTALGCAMLISVACGIYKSLEEATDSMVRYNGTLTPSIENHKKYKKLMEIHDEIYHALKDRDIYKNLFFGSEQ